MVLAVLIIRDKARHEFVVLVVGDEAGHELPMNALGRRREQEGWLCRPRLLGAHAVQTFAWPFHMTF